MKYLLLDMDGTICEYYDPIDNRILMTEFPDEFFTNKVPLMSIIKVIQKDYKDYVGIIFSVSPNSQTDKEKTQWLYKYGFGNWNKIFLHYPNNDKGQALSVFIQRNNISPEDITVIDDDHRVLRNCEKLGVHCIHVSHLLALYESNREYYDK